MTVNINLYKDDINKLLELLTNFRKRDQTEDYKTVVDSIGLLVSLIVSSPKNFDSVESNNFFDNLDQSIEIEIERVQKETKEDINSGNMKNYQSKLRLIKQLKSVKSSFPLRVKVDVIEYFHGNDSTKKVLQRVADKMSEGFLLSGLESKTKSESCLKDKVIERIVQLNGDPDISKHITTLYYKDENNEWQFVNDYTSFIQYMSDELQDYMKSGRTLTKKLENELKQWHRESIYEPVNKNDVSQISDSTETKAQSQLEKLSKLHKNELILSDKQAHELLKAIEILRNMKML
ncbi:hypothetical protein ACFVQB_14570 [Paenibacillus sp. NPDC057886]|uniref:hypothetical protein n=1 Tax=Paenibacillus sp. NPDC057886 TaxID=3346270 RepID=UPI00367CD0C3